MSSGVVNAKASRDPRLASTTARGVGDNEWCIERDQTVADGGLAQPIEGSIHNEGAIPWYRGGVTKNMTVRLSDEQAAELDAIAQVENVPVAEAVRRAFVDHIATRRKDRAFQQRLKASIQRNQEILGRLAE